MLKRFNWLIFIPVIVIGLGGVIYYARSIFDSSSPELVLQGIDEEGYYGSDVSCTVKGKDNYKIADISIWLDDKPLVNNYKINRRSFEYNFTITPAALPQGKHKIRVVARDASAHKHESVKETTFFVDTTPLQTVLLKSGDFKIFQGRVLHVQFQVNKDIKNAYLEALSHRYSCVPESRGSLIYECFVPISCEEVPNEHLFRIMIEDKVGNQVTLENKFHVVMYPFKKQVLSINADKVKEEAELGLPEKQLEAELEEATKNSTPRKLWHGAFDVPVEARGISTDFGTLRTTQEKGRYRHNAIDMLGVPRSVICAPQAGVVVIKNRYAHSGNTIVLDHGCGLLSLFFHLDSLADLNVGDKVEKGNRLGTLGKTGYASGYHLHWEMRLYNIQVDPMQWTKHDF
jgi:hypothetical protein